MQTCCLPLLDPLDAAAQREREREGDADMFLVKLFACVRVGNRESGTEA